MKKLLVLVALSMVMLTGCGSEKTENVNAVKESSPAVVTEDVVVDRGPAFVELTDKQKAEIELEKALQTAKGNAMSSFIYKRMEELEASYSMTDNEYKSILKIVSLLANDGRATIEDELDVLSSEEDINKLMHDTLESYMPLEKIVEDCRNAGYDLVPIDSSNAFESTATVEEVATIDSAVEEPVSSKVYRDEVDDFVIEFLEDKSANLPAPVEDIIVNKAFITSESNYVSIVVFETSDGVEYIYDMTGIHEHTKAIPEEAEDCTIEGMIWVIYNE